MPDTVFAFTDYGKRYTVRPWRQEDRGRLGFEPWHIGTKYPYVLTDQTGALINSVSLDDLEWYRATKTPAVDPDPRD